MHIPLIDALDVVLRVLYVIIVWKLVWKLVYWVTGFHIAYVSINNGISFNGITFERPHKTLTASSIRFRLWGNSRKVIVDDLTLSIRDHKKSENKSQNKKNHEKYNDHNGDASDTRFHVYPSQKWPLRVLARFVLVHFPAVDLELRNTRLNIGAHTGAAEYIKFHAYLKPRVAGTVKVLSKLTATNVSELKDDHYGPYFVSNLLLTYSVVVHLDTGIVDSAKVRAFVNDLRISVFNCIRYAREHGYGWDKAEEAREGGEGNEKGSSDGEIDSDSSDKVPSDKDTSKGLSRIHRLLLRLHSTVSEVSFHFENTQINDIPFASRHNNCTMEEYFNELRPRNSLSLTVKSFSVNMERLLTSSAGYDYLFGTASDHPHHLACTVQLLKVRYNVLPHPADEVLVMPNLLLTCKSNIANHILNGRGFKDGLLEFFATTNLPVVDLTTTQLSDALYNVVVLHKYLRLRKAAGPARTRQNMAEKEHMLSSARLYRLLNEVYPTLNIKLIAEQPRLFVRHHLPGLVQLINLSYSLLNFQLSTTALRDYHLNCDVLSPSIMYVERARDSTTMQSRTRDKEEMTYSKEGMASSGLKNVVDGETWSGFNNDEDLDDEHNPSHAHRTFSSNDTLCCAITVAKLDNLSVTMHIFKNLRVDTKVRVDSPVLDLTKLRLLMGLNRLLRDFVEGVDRDLRTGLLNRTLREKQDKKNRERREIEESRDINDKRNNEEKSQTQQTQRNSTFGQLPAWLVRAKVEVDLCAVLLGSRLVLLPPELVSQANVCADHVGPNEDLRYVKVGVEHWCGELKGHELEESEKTEEDTKNDDEDAKKEDREDPEGSSVMWLVKSELKNLTVATNLDLGNRTDQVLRVPSITSVLTARDVLHTEVNVDTIALTYDRYRLFTLVGSVYVVRELLVRPVKDMAHKLRRDWSRKTSEGGNDPEQNNKIVDRGDDRQVVDDGDSSGTDSHVSDSSSSGLPLTLGVKISKIEVVAHLSDEFKTRLQVLALQVRVRDGVVNVRNDFVRMMVELPVFSHQWVRVVCMDTVEVTVNDPHSEQLVNVSTDSIRLIQPHRFLVHELFDNISVTAKTAKSLVRFIKQADKSKTIMPHELPAIILPRMALLLKKMSFVMEDDPFESDLNMIYQLGKVEQRKRLEKLSIFESHAHRDSVADSAAKLANLHELFSKSWVRKVRVYRASLNDEIVENKEYLFGTEATFASEFNEDVVAYPSFAPLFQIIMSDVALRVQKPVLDKYTDLSHFLHDIGQGQPLDTRYSLLVPMYLNLALGELRMHLRDYPLPLLHVPSNHTRPCLQMSGNLVIAEAFVTEREHMKYLDVSLTREEKRMSKRLGKERLRDGMRNGLNKDVDYHSVTIAKSLSTVKLFTDMHFNFDTKDPSRFVWGQSYQFGIQETMLHFDTFSKTPVDPSRKLGFWDKMKLVMHGRCQVRTQSRLEVAMKGSNDPYDLFDTASGFVLSFENNVVWNINENDDSRLFIKIHSDDVLWYIPNYLGAPLLAWTRDSAGAVYLPLLDKFITSVFGYYIGAPRQTDPVTTKVLEKIVVNLKGGVDFAVGFLLQRKEDKKEREERDKKQREQKASIGNDIKTRNIEHISETPNSKDIQVIPETPNFKDTEDVSPNHLHAEDSQDVSVPFSAFPGDFSHVVKLNTLDLLDGLQTSPSIPSKSSFRCFSRSESSTSVTTAASVCDSYSSRTSHLKPHYEVLLWNPDFCEEGHDSFRGFRSDYIHMAITLHANKDTAYNSIHLSPKAFEQFFKWWKLFSGNTSLPIRRGPLFGETTKLQKFLQLLFTNKFDFNFNSVFISHVYRDNNADLLDNLDCVGVRAKMERFLMDLHQRKEPRIQVAEGTHKKTKIMKMNFNVGEIHLVGIDMRVVRASFSHTPYTEATQKNPEKDAKWTLFDNDKRWYDIQDYEEAFKPSLEGTLRSVKIYPLVYSKRFSYVRDTGSQTTKGVDGFEEFGNEETHECTLNLHRLYVPHMEAIQHRIKELEGQLVAVKRDRREEVVAGVSDYVSNLNERIEFLHDKLEKLKVKIHEKSNSTNSCSDGFHNKFVLVNMFFKWNVSNRNLLLRYIHFVQNRKVLANFLSYDSMKALDEIIQQNDEMTDIRTTSSVRLKQSAPTNEYESSAERMKNFDSIIRSIKLNESISEDFLIEILVPQIQLQSEETPDLIVLISTPRIDSKIILVREKGAADSPLVNPRVLEKRYGVSMQMANVFVLHKNDLESLENLIYSKVNYGSKLSWPPWLGLEICNNPIWAGKDKLLVEKTSFMMTYEQHMPLTGRVDGPDDEGSSDADSTSENEESIKSLRIDFPKLVISSTSKQYFTLYVIVLSLLFYTEPMSKSLQEKLEKLKFLIDFQDLRQLKNKVVSLHRYNELLDMLLRNFSFRQNKMNNDQLNEFLLLTQEKDETVANMYLMMRAFSGGDIAKQGGKKPAGKWRIRADEIILHMLENDRRPMLELAMAGARYKRVINEDGLDSNQLAIHMMQGFSLISGAECPAFLEPYKMAVDETRDLIKFKWNMNKAVGGIKIIEKVDIATLPLNIRIDEITGKKLMKFIFGTDLDIEELPLMVIAKKNENNDNSDDNDSRISEEYDSDFDDDKIQEVRDDDENNSTTNKDLLSDNTTRLSHWSRRKKATSLGLSLGGDFAGIYEDQVQEMVGRSKKYFSVVKLNVAQTSLLITIRLKNGYKRLLNVQDFLLNLPSITIENRILSFLEITKVLQKVILKTLLSHTGRLLKNKVLVKKKRSKAIIGKPLHPLRRYAKLTKVSELIDEGDRTKEIPGES